MNEKQDRSCRTCKYEEIGSLVEPCASCGCGYYLKWTPKVTPEATPAGQLESVDSEESMGSPPTLAEAMEKLKNAPNYMENVYRIRDVLAAYERERAIMERLYDDGFRNAYEEGLPCVPFDRLIIELQRRLIAEPELMAAVDNMRWRVFESLTKRAMGWLKTIIHCRGIMICYTFKEYGKIEEKRADSFTAAIKAANEGE